MPQLQPDVRTKEERDRLVLQWTGLVKRVCKDLSRYMPRLRKRLGTEDAEQIGYLGLIRAASLWKDEAMLAAEGKKPVKFKTYAYRAIKTHISRAVLLVPSTVKPPNHNKIRPHLEPFARAAFRSGTIGDGIGDRLIGFVLDRRIGDQRVCDTTTPTEKREQVRDLLRSIPHREARVLWWHFGHGWRMDAIAVRLGITHEGVRAMINRTVRRIRQRLGIAA